MDYTKEQYPTMKLLIMLAAATFVVLFLSDFGFAKTPDVASPSQRSVTVNAASGAVHAIHTGSMLFSTLTRITMNQHNIYAVNTLGTGPARTLFNIIFTLAGPGVLAGLFFVNLKCTDNRLLNTNSTIPSNLHLYTYLRENSRLVLSRKTICCFGKRSWRLTE